MTANGGCMVELLEATRVERARVGSHVMGHLDLPIQRLAPSRVSPYRRAVGVGARMTTDEVWRLFGLQP